MRNRQQLWFIRRHDLLFIHFTLFLRFAFFRCGCCCCYCWFVFFRSLLFMRLWINLHCFSFFFDTVLFMCKKCAHIFAFCFVLFSVCAIWMAQSGLYQTDISLFFKKNVIDWFVTFNFRIHTHTTLQIQCCTS